MLGRLFPPTPLTSNANANDQPAVLASSPHAASAPALETNASHAPVSIEPCDDAKASASASVSEVERLKAENEALRFALRHFQTKYRLPAPRLSESTSILPSCPPSAPAAAAAASACSTAAAAATTPSTDEVSGENSDDEVEGSDEKYSATSVSPRPVAKSFADSLQSAEGTEQFFHQLQDYVQSAEFLSVLKTTQMCEADDAVLVQSPYEDDEVGVVDVSDIDWWTIVPSPEEEESSTELEPAALDGPYVFVDDEDIVRAVAEFVAVFIAKIPECKNLSNEQLQSMLAGTFAELQEKSTLRKMWDWGSMLYTTYGWGMMGVNLYREPAMAKMVLQGVWTASKWLMMCMSLM